MASPSPYRPEFEAALRMLARISLARDRAGHRLPILVGGAAVEIYTRGAVATGDFDLSCGRQALFTLCEALDVNYMDRRIREETAGDYSLQDVRGEA